MLTIQKSIHLLLIAILFLVSACGDDEEPMEVSREEMMVGTWTLQEQDIDNVRAVSNGNPVPQFIVDAALSQFREQLQLFSENTTVTFNEDDTYTANDPNVSTGISGEWELRNNDQDVALSGLNVTGLLPSDTIVFNIRTLSETNLSLFTNINISDLRLDIPTVGETEADVSGDYQLNLTKQ